MITLVVILCHFAIVPLCTDEVVATSDFASYAGKTDAPVEMNLSMELCKLEGQAIVSSWMQQHPIYHDGSYYVKEIKCIPGRYEPTHRA
jgi:hypothetical protein